MCQPESCPFDALCGLDSESSKVLCNAGVLIAEARYRAQAGAYQMTGNIDNLAAASDAFGSCMTAVASSMDAALRVFQAQVETLCCSGWVIAQHVGETAVINQIECGAQERLQRLHDYQL